MHVVLTNDDGIDAPGLRAMREAAASLEMPLVVVAPAECHSGCGHRVTTDRGLRVDEIAAGWFRVAGTPADCVRIALAKLVPDAAIVLSGINAGGNLGADIHLSGTVAAAREAAIHGVASLAASQYRGGGSTTDWDRAARWLAGVLAAWRKTPPVAGEFWNVNLPDLAAGSPDPEVVACDVDASPHGLDYGLTDEGWTYSSCYHQRPRVSGGDVDTCFGGRITVSRLRVV